ncbi:uncharacterized protein LOC105647746 isoform X2 [Jatropha curcas]|uniref:uncharacterized protein LOC105647746 isoform X2 n=1 Tax=Jatropha curcas TaxID=180498 RepID=UPI0009D6F17A|nr:uncharacterized protein LOC105647746 isoform X2 [Jatropha curcas]
MSKEDSISKMKDFDLLNQFELILESDPLIDEVGFIHPSQFATLRKEAESTESQSIDGILSSEMVKATVLDPESTNFWNRDHKLGISTHVILELYKAAKDAFMESVGQYRRIDNIYTTSEDFSSLEKEVMKHSKAILLLSCDFGTAWNSSSLYESLRKSILSKKQHIPMFIDELLLSALVLSYSPKSELAWCHRRWVIKMIAGRCSTMREIIGKESELVEQIAERSKMNYRAWNHRCWLVSYMTREQVLVELKKSRNWAGLHVADNSCFHYRARLMLKILEESCHKQEAESSDENVEIYQIWQEELHWNEELIKHYIGREALWLHRRFLSLCWIKHFAPLLGDVTHQSKDKSSMVDDVNFFWDNELYLVNSCSTIPDNNYDDFQAQAVHSATYILWLIKISKPLGIELTKKLNSGSFVLLNAACPERSSLWSTLTAYVEATSQLLNEDIY